MQKFLKYFLTVIFGSIVSFFLFFMLLFSFIGILSSMGNEEVKVKENSILILNINGPMSERGSDNPLDQAFSQLTGQSAPASLNQTITAIKKAKKDSRIRGIFIESGQVAAGYATIEEIRNQLLDFKESGKFIYSFAPTYSQKSYYLASVADKIYLTPTGMLDFQGLSSSHIFFKGTLDKMGIEMQIFKHGEFKSAVEPFILEKMSAPARLQTETYLSSIWNNTLKNISKSRDLTVEQLNAVAEKLPAFMSDDELQATGLIDGHKYKDEVIDELKLLTETKLKNDLNSITASKYHSVYLPSEKKGLEKNKIAVIYAVGGIDDPTSSGGINSEELSRTIRKVRRDSTIKAVVLRVNSPGGSGLGSEIIWREVQLTQKVKPVIASMGDYAASGGYYIACAADSIVAQPNTLTGSIGVFGTIPNFKGALNKIGITTDIVKTNTFADMPAADRSFTQDEKIFLQNYIERFYRIFLQRCADGRKTTIEAINQVGEGRVWSGENAIEINLVDKIGGIDDAIEMAKNMANIESFRVVEFPEQLPFIEQMMKDLTENASIKLGQLLLGEEYWMVKKINELKASYPIQARLPYDISIQ